MNKKIIIFIITLLLILTSYAFAGQKEFLIDDFEGSVNALGGGSSTYQKDPSRAMFMRTTEQSFNNSGHSLAIRYQKKTEGGQYGTGGWCGYYTMLKKGSNYFDASFYKSLTFEVKGAKGGENFKVGMANKHWEELGDTIKSDMITKYLPEGKITTRWQKAIIPLSAFSLDTKDLASLAICFENDCFVGSPTDGTIYIDDIKFESTPGVEIKNETLPELPKAEPDLQHPRSLWVWTTDVLGSSVDRKKLFGLCQSAAITNLYVYFGNSNPKDSNCALELAQFLKEAHAKNLRVEALGGKPIWAFSQYHNECINWINSFINTGIDGISLDIEPYLTPQWQADKQKVCSEFLELLKNIRADLAEHKQNMRLGIAVPSFYYQIDKGKFVEDTLKYIDYIVIMDYFDNSSRILEGAEPYLVTADKMNKKISIGVETQDLVSMGQGSYRLTFFVKGWQEMENVLNKVKEKVVNHPSFEGFAIHCDYSYMALTKDRNAPLKERPPVDKIYHIYSQEKTKPIKIDGKLDDWDLSKPYLIDKKENVVYGANLWQGPKDLSAVSFSVWDENNIYFAFRVTDDKIVQEKTGKDIWEGDHVQVWFDADLMGDYNEAVNSSDDYQIGFSPGNFKNIPPEVYIWVPEGISNDYKSKIQIASTKISDGYIIETCISASIFGINKFKKGDKFGISIGPSDQDDPAVPQKLMMSSSPNWVWGDPTTFGILELQ